MVQILLPADSEDERADDLLDDHDAKCAAVAMVLARLARELVLPIWRRRGKH